MRKLVMRSIMISLGGHLLAHPVAALLVLAAAAPCSALESSSKFLPPSDRAGFIFAADKAVSTKWPTTVVAWA
jgi:hypothetical protein